MTRPDPNRAPTIYDVAREAGLSHQSVSRVLRGVSTTRPDTRERVEAAMARLGYRPNAGARELARGRTRRIGVVGYEAFQASTSLVLGGMHDVAQAAGYRLEIVSVPPDGDVDDIALEMERLNASDVVGVLATSPTEAVRAALGRVRFRMPVFFDLHGEHGTHTDDATDHGADRVSVAADIAMSHLIELGHQHIAHLPGRGDWDAAARREAVYRDRMAGIGVEPLVLPHGDWSAASGFSAVMNAPSSTLDGTTALFVANDRMALGALRALTELGRSVPGDVSVIAIDDIPEAAYFSPPLSTVRIDFAASGRVAMHSLIGLIENPGRPLPAYPERTLAARASTAPPAT